MPIDFHTQENKNTYTTRTADLAWREMVRRLIDLNGKTVMVEYSSPNTNKPLHLGHLRNNFLGYSVAQILKANGHKVTKVQIINDRGLVHQHFIRLIHHNKLLSARFGAAAVRMILFGQGSVCCLDLAVRCIRT